MNLRSVANKKKLYQKMNFQFPQKMHSIKCFSIDLPSQFIFQFLSSIYKFSKWFLKSNNLKPYWPLTNYNLSTSTLTILKSAQEFGPRLQLHCSILEELEDHSTSEISPSMIWYVLINLGLWGSRYFLVETTTTNIFEGFSLVNISKCVTIEV